MIWLGIAAGVGWLGAIWGWVLAHQARRSSSSSTSSSACSSGRRSSVRPLATFAGLFVLRVLVAGLRTCVDLLDGVLGPETPGSGHNFEERHQRRSR